MHLPRSAYKVHKVSVMLIASYWAWKTIHTRIASSWGLWKVGILKWKMCCGGKLQSPVFYPSQTLWNTHPNPNNTVNSKLWSPKDPKHVFFRSRLLFPRRHTTGIEDPRTRTCIASSVPSLPNIHKPPAPTRPESPVAPTHLMFSWYYVQMDSHNCIGEICCLCWR